ncbi:hypothetical protein NLJ89_g9077 [Agrocybe chaxingu]|uniref:F-box domain-containing protein n=1 Tax=Agrocybe chaxingu TaxID=84603 RepID=A0A9W8JTR5_9AGAR|nr:hypothetical protein NLJ89_g9077 [Agrocybe chaxingu]
MPPAPHDRRCLQACHRRKRLQAVNSNAGKQQESYEKKPPALSLPTEVACAIFEEASKASPFSTGGVSLPGRELFAISQVCKAWRDIALDYSILWTTFAHSDRGPVKGLNRRTILHRLELHMQRSRGRPVDLWVDTLSPRLSDGFYGAFVRHMDRWRRASFKINPSAVGVLQSTVQSIVASNLESFKCVPSHDNALPHFHFLSLRLNAPKLATLHTEFRVLRYWHPSTVIRELEFNQWSYEDSDRLPWSTFLDVISSSTLSKLTLRALKGGTMFKLPTEADKARRVDTNLERLYCSDPRVAEAMWGFIRSARRLQGLSFDSLGVYSKWDILQVAMDNGFDLLEKNTHRRFPALNSVFLINCSISKANFECLAKMTPRVAALGVTASRTMNEMPVDVLMSREEKIGERIVWPTLKIIRANIKDLKRAQYNSYSGFLLRRSRMEKHCNSCKLLLYTPEADLWKEKDAEGWGKLLNAGVVCDAGERVMGERL